MDRFAGLAIDGDAAVVFSQFGGETGDSAYVFEQVEGAWVYRQQLSADMRSNSYHAFMSVAIEGHTLAIAIDGNSVVDVYERGADTWQRTAKLRPDTILLGASVVIRGDTLIVSQYLNPATPGGSVTVYERDEVGWRERTVLSGVDPQPLDGFGATLATDGETIVVRSVDSAPIGAVISLDPYVVHESKSPSGLYVFGFNDDFVEELPPEEPPTPDPLPPVAPPDEPPIPDPLPPEAPPEEFPSPTPPVGGPELILPLPIPIGPIIVLPPGIEVILIPHGDPFAGDSIDDETLSPFDVVPTVSVEPFATASEAGISALSTTPAAAGTSPSPLARLQAVVRVSSTDDAEGESSQDDKTPTPAGVDEALSPTGPLIDGEIFEEVLEALAPERRKAKAASSGESSNSTTPA